MEQKEFIIVPTGSDSRKTISISSISFIEDHGESKTRIWLKEKYHDGNDIFIDAFVDYDLIESEIENYLKI